MSKTITSNQLLGERGEAAVRLRFLDMGFQFDQRSRLESGIDGIAEIMIQGQPTARMIAVQIKTTESGKYVGEDDCAFSYLLNSKDLAYWRPSNLPVIIVLHRTFDNTFYWKDVTGGIGEGERRLQFDKQQDVLDRSAVDRLAALTVPKAGFGYYVPPLGEGEEAIVNMLPIKLPEEMFVSTTAYDRKKAAAILLDGDEPARFDWVIKGGIFWSFHDPRESVCRTIVDLDQVEAIDTRQLAFHEDVDERYNFSHLLRQMLGHQMRAMLAWNKDRKLYYFRAAAENESLTYHYDASKKRAVAEVVNVVRNKVEPTRVDFVRHHAFEPRFENLYDQWFLVITPTYFFTFNGFTPHSYPDALLSGKKRLDKSASLRGQVIMWHRVLTEVDRSENDLFSKVSKDPRLRFGEPPVIELSTRVPEDVWGTPKKHSDEDDDDNFDFLNRLA